MAHQRIRSTSPVAVGDWTLRTHFLFCQPTHSRDRSSRRPRRAAGHHLGHGPKRRYAVAVIRVAPRITWSIFGDAHPAVAAVLHKPHRCAELRGDFSPTGRGDRGGVLHSSAPRDQSGPDGRTAIRVDCRLVVWFMASSWIGGGGSALDDILRSICRRSCTADKPEAHVVGCDPAFEK